MTCVYFRFYRTLSISTCSKYVSKKWCWIHAHTRLLWHFQARKLHTPPHWCIFVILCEPWLACLIFFTLIFFVCGRSSWAAHVGYNVPQRHQATAGESAWRWWRWQRRLRSIDFFSLLSSSQTAYIIRLHLSEECAEQHGWCASWLNLRRISEKRKPRSLIPLMLFSLCTQAVKIFCHVLCLFFFFCYLYLCRSKWASWVAGSLTQVLFPLMASCTRSYLFLFLWFCIFIPSFFFSLSFLSLQNKEKDKREEWTSISLRI